MKPLDICEATSGLAFTAIGETAAKPDTTDQDSDSACKHETTEFF